MRKSSNSFRNSGTYTSPGTPDYRDNNKGWYSERVPLPSNGSRSHISAAALIPFNSGRTLPSKWDDAERWITSPVSGFGVCKTVVAPPQRRHKSKSGPLGGNPGVAYFSNYSPAVPVLEGGRTRSFIAGSPLTTGVLVPEGLSIHYGRGIGAHSNPAHSDYGVVRSSSSIPGWSELLIESSLPSSQDEKHDETKDAEDTISLVVSQRDIATQMSPVGSNASSPKGKLSFSTSPPPPIPFAVDLSDDHSAKLEIRDVQVDKGTTITRQSKRHGVRRKKKRSPDVKDLALTWETAEGAMRTSKLQKEEARITAWENLQNAKAEAAIQKLEMKLEKKRSASIDKILNKLKVAQVKAQDMRKSMSESPRHQAPRNSSKVLSFRKFVKMHSLNGCFTCHVS